MKKGVIRPQFLSGTQLERYQGGKSAREVKGSRVMPPRRVAVT